MTDFAVFGHNFKATERSPQDNLTRWIITQSKGFTRKGIEQISRSVRTYVYLVLTSQIHARSSIVGNSAPAVDAQKVFNSTFKALINEDYSIAIDIERYQGVLEHALSKVDFSMGTSMYMLPNKHVYASKQFKLKHWKDEGTEQQNFSEQHRHENWFKQRHKQGP